MSSLSSRLNRAKTPSFATISTTTRTYIQHHWGYRQRCRELLRQKGRICRPLLPKRCQTVLSLKNGPPVIFSGTSPCVDLSSPSNSNRLSALVQYCSESSSFNNFHSFLNQHSSILNINWPLLADTAFKLCNRTRSFPSPNVLAELLNAAVISYYSYPQQFIKTSSAQYLGNFLFDIVLKFSLRSGLQNGSLLLELLSPNLSSDILSTLTLSVARDVRLNRNPKIMEVCYLGLLPAISGAPGVNQERAIMAFLTSTTNIDRTLSSIRSLDTGLFIPLLTHFARNRQENAVIMLINHNCLPKCEKVASLAVTVLSFFEKRTQSCIRIFHAFKDANIPLHSEAYGVLCRSLCRLNDKSGAVSLIYEMMKSNVIPSFHTLIRVLRSLEDDRETIDRVFTQYSTSLGAKAFHSATSLSATLKSPILIGCTSTPSLQCTDLDPILSRLRNDLRRGYLSNAAAIADTILTLHNNSEFRLRSVNDFNLLLQAYGLCSEPAKAQTCFQNIITSGMTPTALSEFLLSSCLSHSTRSPLLIIQSYIQIGDLKRAMFIFKNVLENVSSSDVDVASSWESLSMPYHADPESLRWMITAFRNYGWTISPENLYKIMSASFATAPRAFHPMVSLGCQLCGILQNELDSSKVLADVCIEIVTQTRDPVLLTEIIMQSRKCGIRLDQYQIRHLVRACKRGEFPSIAPLVLSSIGRIRSIESFDELVSVFNGDLILDDVVDMIGDLLISGVSINPALSVKLLHRFDCQLLFQAVHKEYGWVDSSCSLFSNLRPHVIS